MRRGDEERGCRGGTFLVDCAIQVNQPIVLPFPTHRQLHLISGHHGITFLSRRRHSIYASSIIMTQDTMLCMHQGAVALTVRSVIRIIVLMSIMNWTSHCSILNILGELLDCKSESSYIDCLNPDDIDCMVYCILTQ